MKIVKKIVAIILLTIIMTNNASIAITYAKINLQNDTNVELATTKLESEKYIVSEKDALIKRVLPETPIGTFKSKFNVPKSDVVVYKSIDDMTEVEEGNVATGMVVQCKNSDKKYVISVIGDLNSDGNMGEIELNILIKYIVGINTSEIQGILAESADINGDSAIDQIDVTILIRWIVYGELDIDESKKPEAPEIKVIEGTKGENEWYKSNVKIEIAKQEDDIVEVEKILYSINDEDEKIINSGEEIEITEDGEYTIKAYAYSKDGYESNETTTKINIEKQVNTEEINVVKVSSNQIRVEVQAEAISGIAQYIYYIGKETENAEIEYTKVGETAENNYTYGNLLQNTQYVIKVEVKSNAGNKKEVIEKTTTKQISSLTLDDVKINGNTTEWTNQNIEAQIQVSEQANPDGVYKIEYKIGENNWQEYNGSLTIEENTEIQVRLTDGTNYSNVITKQIENIDKTEPNGEIETTKTTHSITVNVNNVEDSQSGIEKLTYYLGSKNQNGEIEYTKSEEGQNFQYIYEGLKQDEEYVVVVEIQDKAGNIKRIEQTVRTNKFPEINISNIEIGYSNTNWTNENVIVSIRIKDGIDLGECRLEYSIDGGKNWSEYKEEVKVEIEENTNIIVRLTDGINDLEVASGRVSNIDKQKPEGTLKVEQVKTNKVKVEVEGIDDISGVKGYIYYLGTENEQGEIEYIKCAENWQEQEPREKGKNSYTYGGLKQNTKYYIKVEVQDKAGNIVELYSNQTTKKIPALNYLNMEVDISEKEWTKEDVIIKIKLDEDIADTEYEVEYTKDGGNTWEIYDEENGIIVEQNTEVQVRLTDGENSGEGTTIEINNIDKTAPQITIEEIDSTSNSISVEIEAEDTQSGIKGYIYYLGKENEHGEIEYIEYARTNEKEYEYTSLDQNTTYYVKIEAIDNVGNVGNVENSIKTTEIPSGTETIILTQDRKEWTNGNVLVTIKYTTTPYEVEYSINGEDWTKSTQSGERILIEKNTTVYARLTDGNNVGESTSLEITNIDKTIPTVEKYEMLETNSDGFTVRIQTADDLSGISSVTWYMRKQGTLEYTQAKETYTVQEGLEAGTKELTKEKTYTGLEQGTTYQVYAQVYDVAGNKIETEIIDITTKEITDLTEQNTIITATPSTWTNASVDIKIETTVEGYEIEYSLDGKNWYKYTGLIKMEKNGTIYARLTDGTNVGESVSTTITNIDRVNPTIENIEIKEKTSKDITASIEVEDIESGLGKIEWYYKHSSQTEYTIEEQNYQTINGADKGETVKVSKTLELNNIQAGSYTIYAKVYDVAGNVVQSQLIVVETVQIPTGNNAITMTPNITNWTNENVIVTLESNEKDFTIQYSTDGKKWIDGTRVEIDKNQTIYARLTDGVNLGEVASLKITNIDKTKTVIEELVAKTVTSKQIEAQITIQDTESGLGKIEWYYKHSSQAEYTIEEQNYQTINGTEAGETTKVSKILELNNIQAGNYTIYAKVYDVAGNVIQTEELIIQTNEIPTGSAAITITPDITYWTNKDIIVLLSSNVTGYDIEYSTNGNDWTIGTSVKILSNGTVYARLTDGINVGTAASARVANIDKAAPTVESITSANVTTKGFTAKITVTDSLSGLGRIDWYYKLSTETNYTKVTQEYEAINGNTAGTTTQVTKQLILDNLVKGTYNVYAKVYDVAGNIKESAVTNITTTTIGGATEGLESGNIKASAPVWNNKVASITLSTTSGLTIQYQVNGTAEEGWTTGTSVTGLKHNDKVYARLTDGVNAGTPGSVTILDEILPTVTVSKGEIKTNSIEVSVTSQDAQSGMIEAPVYSYYIKKTSEDDYEGTPNYTGTERSYTFTGLTQTTSYDVKVTTEDIAGNKGTGTSNGITTKTVDGLTSDSVTFSQTPTNWTKENVTVTIATTVKDYKIEYSTNGSKWYEYAGAVIVEANGTVYARLTDGINVGTSASTKVANIDKALPTVGSITSANVTTKGFTAKITVTDSLSGLGRIDWYYKLSTETNYTKVTQEYEAINGNTAGTTTQVTKQLILDNLVKGTYNVYAKVYDVAGNIKESAVTNITTTTIGGATEGLESGNIKASAPVWNNKVASITLSTTSGLTIQYQVNGTAEEGWTTGTSVTGLKHNDKVYARLTDGVNAGTPGSVTILDEILPTVTVSKGEIKTNSIEVSVTSQDAQSGMIEAPVYSYYIKKTSEDDYEGTPNYTGTERSYTFTGLTQTTSYDVKVTTEDIAGNKGTGTSNGITTKTVEGATEGLKTGNIIASDPIWSNGSASITLSTTSSLTIQYQVNGTSGGGWMAGTSVTGLKHNDKVYARLTDGVNAGTPGSVTILDKIAPTVTVTKGTVTTNSIAVSVISSDAQSGISTNVIYNYYIKKSGESYSTPIYTGTDKNYIFTGLTQTTSYDVKVTTEDIAGNKGTGTSNGIITKTVEDLTSDNVTFSQTPTNWTKENVTVAITTTAKDYAIQYSTNGKNWYKYTGTVIVKTNGTIYARLTDGINVGASASTKISNIDKTAPTIGSVTGSTTAGNKGTITVTGMADSQSGIEAVSISKTNGVYEWINTTNSSYTKQVEGSNANGTWYVYVRDNVGNISTVKTTTVSGIVDKVSNVNLRTTDLVLDVGETKQIEISYDGTPKTITYVSSDTGIATVSTSGIVTGKKVGKTNVTVILTNYDGTTIEKTAQIEIRDYLVTYDYITNGGTASSKNSERVGYGKSVDLTAVATKTGWNFVGWNTDKTATTGLTSLTMPKNDITLYAIYSKTITVTCYYYSGTASTNKKVTGTMYNTETTTTITLPTITEISKNSLSWTGRGWSTSTTANTSSYTAGGKSVNLSSDRTYYASYQTTVKATYNYYSGSAATSSSQTATAYMSYNGGMIGGTPTVPTIPTISGYTQRGWSKSSAYNAATVTPGAITENVTYYTSYTTQITVTYNMNGGTGTAPAAVNGTCYMAYNGTKTGASVTMSSTTEVTKLHYDRVGWNSKADGTGTNYTNGTSYTFNQSTTLYAKWTSKGNYVVDNTSYYKTLSEAVEGANSGSTIEVLATNTDSGAITIDKDITLNLSDYTVTKSSAITIESGVTVNIEGNANGTLQNTSLEQDYITNKGTLNIKSGTINNKSNPTARDTAVIYNSGTVNMSGGTIIKRKDGDGFCIENINQTNITGGTIDSTSYETLVNNGELAIDGGIIKGSTSVHNSGKTTMRDGELIGSLSGIKADGDNGEVIIEGGRIEGKQYGIDAKSYANVNIKGGEIEGKKYGIYTGHASVNIKGGKIAGKDSGICVDQRATIKIDDGIVEGETYGIKVVSKATNITIGNETQDLTKPQIIGSTQGINSDEERYTFKYYSGQIMSTNNENTYNMTATYKKNGYVPKTIYDSENGRYVTSLILLETTVNYIIQEEEIGYTTLLEAVTAAQDGDTIIALRNYSNSDEINIDKNIILNLNGLTTTKTTSSIIVEEDKTLTIRGDGTLASGGSIHTIINNGTVDIEVGKNGILSNTSTNFAPIYNTKNVNMNAIGKLIGITYGIYNEETGTVNMQDGTLEGTTYGIYNEGIGTVNMQNGLVKGETYGIYNKGAGTVNMQEGSISSNTGIYNEGTGTVNMQEGSISSNIGIYNKSENGYVNIKYGDINVNSCGIYMQSGTLKITGGWIHRKEGAKGIHCVTGNVTISNIRMADSSGSYSSTIGIYNENGTITLTSPWVMVNGDYYGIYNVSGNVTINDIYISNYNYNPSHPSYAIYNDSGTVKINNVDIRAEGYGIYNNSGTVNIMEGTIKADNENAIQNYGTLTIGNETETYVNNAVILASHSSYGLYTTTNVNIYTGVIIKGTSSTPYSSSQVTFPDGYAANIGQITEHCDWNNSDGQSVHGDITLYETTLSPIVSTISLMALPLGVLSLFSNVR